MNAQESIADLDLQVLAHTAFGKGVMKKFKISPDAYIQMALQLAYYRVRLGQGGVEGAGGEGGRGGGRRVRCMYVRTYVQELKTGQESGCTVYVV